MNLYIGLMSGTSMDGIDAALVDLDTNTLIGGITRTYSTEAKQLLQRVLTNECSAAVIAQLHTLLGREFAYAALDILQKTNIAPQQVIAIGSHGQTICHDAMAKIPYTVQLGCPHTITELTKITVVADFRTRDLLLGGQGAPFAPIFHQALFGNGPVPLAIVNIGGIANITLLTEGSKVSGYDVGPGNCLMDAWMEKHHGLSFDASGEWAATGEVIQPLLTAMLADPYFLMEAPKSLGKEYFSPQWLERHLYSNYNPADVQATLLALTVKSITHAIKNSQLSLQQVIICGGGVHNDALLFELSKELPTVHITSSSGLGIDPDYMEAMMFAWFAHKAINKIPLDLTQITGSKKIAIYGVIFSTSIDKRNSIDV